MNSNVTYNEVSLEEWTRLAKKEMKLLGVKNIEQTPLTFKHAWEFGNTSNAWARWVSEVEKKKYARRHNRPSEGGTDSGGMVI